MPYEGPEKLLNTICHHAAKPHLLAAEALHIRASAPLKMSYSGGKFVVYVEVGAKADFPLEAAERELAELFTELGLDYEKKTPTTPSDRAQTFHFSEEDFIAAVKRQADPEILALYERFSLRHQINNAVACFDPPDPSERFAMIIQQKLEITGRYFPSAHLSRLNDPQYLFREWHWFDCSALSALREPGLTEKVISTIESLGFRRIAYMAHGDSSLVLEGVRDERGRNQLILLSPPSEIYIPHPLMLPVIEQRKVQVNGESLQVRVMPEVNITDVTDVHIEQLRELIKATSGLRIPQGRLEPEIRRDNVGLYTFTNKQGIEVTVPMILDWGAVKWKRYSTTERMEQHIKRWEKMPELALWREAQESFAKQSQNVMTAEELAKYPHDSSIATAISVKGMYLPELGACSEAAIKAAEQGEDYRDALRKEIRNFDPTQSPNSRGRR